MKLCTDFHPLTDGHEERIIHSLEDILREYDIDFKGNCIRLSTSYSRHKSYVDIRRSALVFKVGNQVYLKISRMKEGDEIW